MCRMRGQSFFLAPWRNSCELILLSWSAIRWSFPLTMSYYEDGKLVPGPRELQWGHQFAHWRALWGSKLNGCSLGRVDNGNGDRHTVLICVEDCIAGDLTCANIVLHLHRSQMVSVSLKPDCQSFARIMNWQIEEKNQLSLGWGCFACTKTTFSLPLPNVHAFWIYGYLFLV